MNFRILGKTPSGEELKRIEKSAHFRDGRFRNLEPTSVNPEDVSMIRIMREIMFRPENVRPAAKIPYLKTDLVNLDSQEPVVIWFGHSSYFIVAQGFRILVDPVFSGNAAPLKFFAKAFEGADCYKPEDFDEIDLLILTINVKEGLHTWGFSQGMNLIFF